MKLKLILLFTTIILVTSVKAQSGQVFYEVISKKYESKTESQIDQALIEIENTKILLELKFNKNNSYYYKSVLNKNEGQTLSEETLLILIGFNEFYHNVQDKTTMYEFDNFLIKKNNSLDWKITQQTKLIDQYLCYKATCVEKFETRKGKIKEKIITAWFCPSLPYPFGPLEYNNLPGLILELEKDENKIVTKSIKLSQDEIVIKLPNKKIISEDEYNKKIKERY